MEKLVEYTRLNFEIQMLKENNTFDCEGDSSEKCLCMPGICANYILRSLYQCLKCFNALSSVKWEAKDSRYIAECCDSDNDCWFANFMDDKEKCKYKNEICEKRVEKNFSDAKYVYYKLRSKEELLKKYGVMDANYRIKSCLLHFGEKENNKKDYLYLFTYVVKEYYAHPQFEMVKYLDMLFRLYLFLFDDDGKKLIKRDFQNVTDMTYFEYIRDVVTDYAELGKSVSKGENVNINDAINRLSEYLGINFDAVYNHYSVGMDTGDVRELQEIISKQSKAASEFANNELEEMMFELKYWSA